MNEKITGTGQLNPSVALGGPNILVPYEEHSNKDYVNQYYGAYSKGKLRLGQRVPPLLQESQIFSGAFVISTDIRPWYLSGSYRIDKWLEVGSYYRHFTISGTINVPGQSFAASVSDPSRHLYDKVVTARFDLPRNFYIKAEGHFMDGYGGTYYPAGFYPQVNPQGFSPNTNALVIRAGFSF